MICFTTIGFSGNFICFHFWEWDGIGWFQQPQVGGIELEILVILRPKMRGSPKKKMDRCILYFFMLRWETGWRDKHLWHIGKHSKRWCLNVNCNLSSASPQWESGAVRLCNLITTEWDHIAIALRCFLASLHITCMHWNVLGYLNMYKTGGFLKWGYPQLI